MGRSRKPAAEAAAPLVPKAPPLVITLSIERVSGGEVVPAMVANVFTLQDGEQALALLSFGRTQLEKEVAKLRAQQMLEQLQSNGEKENA